MQAAGGLFLKGTLFAKKFSGITLSHFRIGPPVPGKGESMTISNALIFIQRGQTEKQLREKLNTAANIIELRQVLSEEKLTFSDQEFDQAFHLKLVKCQELEEAEQLKGFKMWWTLLHKYLDPPPENLFMR